MVDPKYIEWFLNIFVPKINDIVQHQCYRYGLFVLLMFLVGAKWCEFKSKRNSNLLTERIKKELTHKKVDLKQICTKLFGQAYFPSKDTFLFLLVIISIIAIIKIFLDLLRWGMASFIIPLSPYVSHILKFTHYDTTVDIAAVHAGIGAFIFALIIFVAESLKEHSAKARVLLKESFLYPLTIIEIIVFITFIWSKDPWLSIVLVCATGILAVLSLSRLIIVLLNKYLFNKKRKDVFKDRLKKSVRQAVDQRVGNNLLLKIMEDEAIKLKVRFFDHDNNNEFFTVEDVKVGVVSEIDLRKLKEVSELIDKCGIQNGYSFSASQKRGIGQDVVSFAVDSVEKQKTKDLVKLEERYLIAKYRDKIDDENSGLISFDRKLIANDEALFEMIQNKAREIFTISPDDNFSDEVRAETTDIREQLYLAISNGKIAEVQSLTELYLGMADAFIEQLEEFNIRYDADAASKERNQLFGGWSAIQWLTEDLVEITKKALHADDEELVRIVLMMPASILIKSIKARNHYVFQQFVWFYSLFYDYSKEFEKHQNMLIVKADKTLVDLSSYYIIAQMKRGTTISEEISDYTSFIKYIVRVYQEIMKKSIDDQKWDDFRRFKTAVFTSLGAYFIPERYELHPNEGNRIEKAKRDIQGFKGDMAFGFSSWLLKLCLATPSNECMKKVLIEMCDFAATDIKTMTLRLLRLIDDRHQDFWGWRWWGIMPSGGGFIGFDHNLVDIYLILVLKQLERVSVDQIESIALDYGNRTLRDWTNDNGRFKERLKKICDENGDYAPFVSDVMRAKTPLLEKFIARINAKCKEKETKEIKTRPIDESKVKSFKSEVVKGYFDHVTVRKILKGYEMIRERLEEGGSLDKRLGVNMIEDKEAFFENWYVHYGHWGIGYGERIAVGEDKNIISEIIDRANRFELEEFEERLKALNAKDDLFILVSHTATYRFLNGQNAYVPEWKDAFKKRNEAHIGNYLIDGVNVPVYQARFPKKKGDLLILNRKKLGEIIYYSPAFDENEKKYTVGHLYINIISFSENETFRKDLIKKSPDWLKEYDGEAGQTEYLLQKVAVQIYEKYEFKLADDFSGLVMSL